MNAALLVTFMLVACAPDLPASYVEARNSAERDYASGHFGTAADAWLEAAQSASSARDRSEARYRAATSYQRAGKLELARKLYTTLAAGSSARAARAAFTLADMRVQRGDDAGGYHDLEAAIRKYPSSGVANLALTRYFAFLADKGGDRAVLEYVTVPPPELANSELAEQLLYERGRRLQALGAAEQAVAAYVTLADRFPYPHGAYWDDALFRGADCELKLRQPQRALALLQRMLAEREASHLSGSYERPRFADAAYRVAELYRDDLRDPVRAQRAFHDVFVDYPSSTLRDDALWQEALLERAASGAAACAPLRLLMAQLPESRFAPCAHEICATLRPVAGRQCRDYIEQELHRQPKAVFAD